MMFELEQFAPATNLRVALIAARFNRFIVDELLAGARDALERHGIDATGCALVWVPGAFELPVMAERLAASGRFDAIVALGAVVRGGTPHFDYVAGECAAGLNRVALDHGLPVAFGVLTTDTVEQALERAAADQGNKGFDVTVTALEMAQAMRELNRLLGDGAP